MIVLSEAHLRRILRSYARYDNDIKTHRLLDKDAPLSRQLSARGASDYTPSSADFTASTSELKFSIHTSRSCPAVVRLRFQIDDSDASRWRSTMAAHLYRSGRSRYPASPKCRCSIDVTARAARMPALTSLNRTPRHTTDHKPRCRCKATEIVSISCHQSN